MFRDQDKPSLVITLPQSIGLDFAYQTRARTTLGVLIQLFSEAKERVIIAAPFISLNKNNLFNNELTGIINSALERGVEIDVLSTGASLNKHEWIIDTRTIRGNFNLYRPSDNINDESKLGSHAKFCIMDGISAYIGSANLTGPGLSSQLEIGLLVQGDVAQQLQEFWDYSIEIGLFILVS